MLSPDEMKEWLKCAKDPVYFMNTYGYIFDIRKNTVGKLEMFEYQKKILKDYQEFRNNICLKSRQCLPENTFVDTPDGPKSIQDFKKGDLVYSYNLGTNDVELDTVSEAWYSGEEHCIKLKLKDSRNIEVGENHPFWVVNKQEWVRAKDLEINDEILDANIGFGEISANEDEIKKIIQTPKSCKIKKTEFKNLPEEVFYWNKKSISLLINKVFDRDGIVNKNNKNLQLGLDDSSLIFLEQIKFLLKKYNIKSNIEEVEKNIFYKLRITNSKSIIKFINEIGIYKKIKPEHLDIIANRKYDVKNTSFVRRITKTEVKKCYDISVSKNENFLINGLLVHNTGISVITSGYVAWRMLFNDNERIIIIANDGAGARRFLASVKQFLDYLPKFLLPDEILVNNTQQIKFSNGSFTKAVASGKQAGRGETATLIVIDEMAFVENMEDIWMGASLALSSKDSKCIMISCVPEDTMIFTDKGIKRISNFIDKNKESGYEVEGYNVYGKDKLRAGNIFFNNGFHKTKKIYTTNSYLEATLNHKVWACKEGVYDWYKMEELNEGDYISIQYGMEIWGNNDDVSDFEPSVSSKILNKFNPKKITKEIAYLIGLYISEGSSYKKYNKNKKFIGGKIDITCGDDVSKAITDLGLSYSCWDGIHYAIGAKNLIEFFEYIGFDLSKKAKEKIIPDRVLEMSRENIIYMLRGIFDGDGYSHKSKGIIGIGLSSKKMIEQIRMLLLNFGILTDYSESLSQITKRVKVQSKRYRIDANGEFSNVFYDKIGFGFNRKQIKRKVLEDFKLTRANSNDIIPFSVEMAKSMVKESGYNTKFFRDNKSYIPGVVNNLDKKYRGEHLTRINFLKLFELCKNKLSIKTIEKINKCLSSNLKWNKINKIEYSEKETYDFSLPENENDFWCHSVIYNGILGHQTPAGTGNMYHSMWTASQKTENDFHPIEVHWKDHPIYSNGIEQRTDEHGSKFLWSPWYEVQCENLNWDKVKIAQELDLSFEGSAAVVIPNWVIDKHEKEILDNKVLCYYDYKEPEKEKRFVDRPGTFHVWEKPVEGYNYIIGADVGRGDGSDYSTIQVLNADTLVQAAEYQGKISPDLFAHIIYNVGMDYNKAYVTVECNSFGLATTLTLKKQLKYDYLRIHHSKSVKKVFVRHAGIDYVDTDEEIPGFQTTSKTRPLLISALTRYMREGIIKINSKRLLQEFRTFIYHKDKAQAASNFHDDLIMSLAIVIFIRETEFDNVFTSKELYKAMLNSISSSRSGPIKELNVQSEQEQNVQRTTPSTNGEPDDSGDNDNWLFGIIG